MSEINTSPTPSELSEKFVEFSQTLKRASENLSKLAFDKVLEETRIPQDIAHKHIADVT